MSDNGSLAQGPRAGHTEDLGFSCGWGMSGWEGVAGGTCSGCRHEGGQGRQARTPAAFLWYLPRYPHQCTAIHTP